MIANTHDHPLIFVFSAASYEIRTGETPLELRGNFYNTAFVNTCPLSPEHAGCKGKLNSFTNQ